MDPTSKIAGFPIEIVGFPVEIAGFPIKIPGFPIKKGLICITSTGPQLPPGAAASTNGFGRPLGAMRREAGSNGFRRLRLSGGGVVRSHGGCYQWLSSHKWWYSLTITTSLNHQWWLQPVVHDCE